MFCFLNFRKSFVDLGFPYGIHIEDYASQMVAGENRKNLRSVRYYAPEDIDVVLLQEILLAAASLNK